MWRALTDSAELGAWFGMKVEGPFVAGKPVRATIVPTRADAEVAKLQKEHAGLAFELLVERMDAERQFAFRWHPHAVERAADYSAEPTTLVTFDLAEAPGGILLTVTESGFDRIPLERRAKAFAANEQGWGMVVPLLEKHLVQTG
ncbi:SRPBCC family protein [soil metagenome]